MAFHFKRTARDRDSGSLMLHQRFAVEKSKLAVLSTGDSSKIINFKKKWIKEILNSYPGLQNPLKPENKIIA